MKKILCVIRVSTTKQETESQHNDMAKWLSSMGYKENEIEWLESAGASARSLNAKYIEMLEDIKRITTTTTIKTVALWHINRLGRVESKLMEMKEFFIKNKVQLLVKQSNVTLLDDEGKLTTAGSLCFSMFAAMVAEETAEMMEKFTRGKAEKRKQGQWDGATLPLGYTTDESNFIIIEEKGAALVRHIFNLYQTGEWSTTRLANELREKGVKDVDGRDFTQSRVATILSKKRYTGYTETTKNGVEFSFPQIITQELFEQCEALRKNGKVVRKHNYASAYLCNKLIQCKCGYHYTASNTVYRCYREHDELVRKVAQSERLQHTEATLSISMMDGIIWQLAAQLEVARLANQDAETLDELKQQLEVAEAKAEAAKDELSNVPERRKYIIKKGARYNMSDDEIDEMMETVNNDEIKLKAALQAAQSDIKRISSAIYKIEHPVIDLNLYESLKENLPDNIEKKRAIVRTYIKRITVSDWETMTLHQQVTLFKAKTSEKRYLIITVEDFDGNEYKYRYFPRWSFGKSRIEEMLSDETWSEVLVTAA